MTRLTVSVVICTFNRPKLLAHAVRTARAQALPDGATAEIVVVDNSPDGNAAPVLATLAKEDGHRLRTVACPVPNIAEARNAGVAAAESAFIAFLDDDEWCEPGWLAALLATAERTGADIVFGTVLADFPAGPPSWDPKGTSFERRLRLATGAALGLRHDRALSGRWIGTGNSLVRRGTCLAAAHPFDPRYGLSGGEDLDLFARLDAEDRRMVWCAEAVVHEVVPADRTALDYMVRRGRRGGQQWAAVAIRQSPRPRLTAGWILVKAIVQAAARAAALAIATARRSPRRAARQLALAQAVGKLRWRDLPTAYF